MRATLLSVIGLLAAGAAHAAPACYPPNAVNTLIKTQPDSYIDWLAASDATFTVTWYCSSGGKWVSAGFYGHKSDLVTDWASQMGRLLTGTKGDRDAEWNQFVTAVPDTSPLHDVFVAQLAATLPTPPIPATMTAYYIVQQKNTPVMLAVGTIPSATPVDTDKQVTVGGKRFCVVPNDALTPFGSVKPQLLYAPCLG
jgi:hypothetical protein